MENKKLLTLTLAAALSAGLLAGCGDETPPEPVESEPAASGAPAESIAPSEKPEETAAPSQLPEETAAPSQAPAETPEVPEGMELRYEDQLALIAANVDQWRLEEEAWSETCWYAYTVADLDLNGRLELLSTVTQGTGLFTTSQVWEVNRAGTGLELLENEDWPLKLVVMNDSEGKVKPCPAYYDRETDTMWLEVYDLVRDGMTAAYESKGLSAVKDGRLLGRPLAYQITEYDGEGKETVRFEGADEGEPITEEEYENAAALAFPDIAPQGIRFLWLEKPDTVAMSTEQLMAQLTACANGYEFGLELSE